MRVSLDDAKEWLQKLRHIDNAMDGKYYDLARDLLQKMIEDIEEEIESGAETAADDEESAS